MKDFENVKLVANANIYMDGKVTSRTFYTPSGERKTLGFIMAGEYKFDTGASEHMEILAGEMDVKLAGETEYTTYTAGMTCHVPGNSYFEFTVKEWVDYCCSFGE